MKTNKILGSIFISALLIFLFSPAETTATEDTAGLLTLPIDVTSVNSHFDLNTHTNQVEDITGFTCEGSCGTTPGNHAYDGHNGIDFRASTGTSITASCKGFWFEYTGLYSAEKILNVPYENPLFMEILNTYSINKM